MYRDFVEKNPDINFKVLLIGDETSGKSSILYRYIDDIFYSSYTSTIGVDYKTKIIKINNKNIKFQIWDTAGQERFKAITTTYYRGIKAIFLIYDISNRQTFQNIDKWIEDINKFAPSDTLILLIGNKLDSDKREVEIKEGIEKANTLKIPFIETSAKNNINIEKAFEIIGEKLTLHYEEFSLSEPELNKIDIKNEKNFFIKWCNIL